MIISRPRFCDLTQRSLNARLIFAKPLLSIALTLMLSSVARGADSGITVQFVARGMQLPFPMLDPEKPGASPGHIFMIMSLATAHGPKEEAYGFYPRSETLKGIVKGPGMLKSEYRCNANDDCNPANYKSFLKRLSESEDSIRLSITSEQRSRILRNVNTWNSKGYDLTSQNCIDFVAAAAKDLGYTAPRSKTQTPEDYLRGLRASVAAEQARQQRETELRQLEEKRRQDAEQELKRQEAAAKAQAQADQEQRARSCLSGTWREQYDKPFTWTFTLTGDKLTIDRNDHLLYGSLAREGQSWVGPLYANGKQSGTISLTPLPDCSKITTNQSWWYRR